MSYAGLPKGTRTHLPFWPPRMDSYGAHTENGKYVGEWPRKLMTVGATHKLRMTTYVVVRIDEVHKHVIVKKKK